jgi:uncharacterized protein (TIGR03435 family)
MKKLMLCVVVLATLFATASRAQDLAGNWQGTLHAGAKDLRIIVNVSKGDKDGWSGKMYSIDQGAQAINTSTIKLDGSSFKFTVDMIGGSYEGKLAADGKSIVGNWSQGGNPLPLTLVKATPETAWDIPAPPAPAKPMAADADPSFDVATIKPNPSGAPSMQGLTMNGRNFATKNSSLGDLLTFAYDVQMKQIVGAPAWMDEDRYDIAAVPDQPGEPNLHQLKTMVQKLLAERFKLTVHHEKREMSAYVLTTSSDGQKLTLTQSKGSLPGFFGSPGTGGMTLHMVNGTLTDFTSFLQMAVLDKPVVDQTGITGRFDSNVTFTPDESRVPRSRTKASGDRCSRGTGPLHRNAAATRIETCC